MSRYAWVCFECRERVRRHGSALNVRCFGCGRPSECLGYKTRIPPKRKVREWKSLREAFFGSRVRWAQRVAVERVRRRHFLEKQIEKLEALPANRERKAWLRRLKERLEGIRGG